MSHEPGRERHMTYLCEQCRRSSLDLIHRESFDEYWCASCIDNENEIAYDRQQQSLMDGETPTMKEQHFAAWLEHEKAHKR